jgi:hypothetical protein
MIGAGVKVHSFDEDNLTGKEKKFLFSQKTVLMSNCSEQLRLQRTKRPQGRAKKNTRVSHLLFPSFC